MTSDDRNPPQSRSIIWILRVFLLSVLNDQKGHNGEDYNADQNRQIRKETKQIIEEYFRIRERQFLGLWIFLRAHCSFLKRYALTITNTDGEASLEACGKKR